jgi:hypothetical protein
MLQVMPANAYKSRKSASEGAATGRADSASAPTTRDATARLKPKQLLATTTTLSDILISPIIKIRQRSMFDRFSLTERFI